MSRNQTKRRNEIGDENNMAKMSKEEYEQTCWRSDKKEYAKFEEKLAKGKKLSPKDQDKMSRIKDKCGL
jgi:hypothetical protein